MAQIWWRTLLSIYLSSGLLLLSYPSVARAQESGETKIVEGGINGCELNSAYLDALTQEARARSERVFVIARLGRGEKSTVLNRNRLHRVRNHLVVTGRLKKDRVVFAEGDRVDSEGRIEFYLGSRLYLVSLAKQGKDVCLTCCDDRFPKPR
jgi:hypothetical protein